MIRSITTFYGGRQFRSRTEARWAVWFDAMGVRFDYEAEGFVVRSGCYLPDFRLPDLKMFFEVKGEDPTVEERMKCAQLTEATEYDMLLAVGGPEERFQLYWFDREGEREDRYVFAQDLIADCGLWLVCDDHSNHIGPNRAGMVPRGPMMSGALEAAYILAASATFTGARRRTNARAALIPHEPSRRASHFRDEAKA